jgi:protein-arginine kinase activator protein McsA
VVIHPRIAAAQAKIILTIYALHHLQRKAGDRASDPDRGRQDAEAGFVRGLRQNQGPRCGFTQADFKKSGRLGCPECYRTFAEGLAGLLKTMHKGTRHTGKAPEALRATRENADRLKTLQIKLTKAIKDENYEQAAQLRDEIKQLGERSSSPARLSR